MHHIVADKKVALAESHNPRVAKQMQKINVMVPVIKLELKAGLSLPFTDGNKANAIMKLPAIIVTSCHLIFLTSIRY